jgi:hypothetical protein
LNEGLQQLIFGLEKCMWVIDIRHWLNEQQVEPAAPQLRLKVKKLTEIITWITSRDRGLPAGETLLQ